MQFRRVIKNYVLASAFWLAICVVEPGVHSDAEAADWPNWRGPNHNGVSNETGWSATWPKGEPKILWGK